MDGGRARERRGSGRRTPLDALALSRLYAPATPQPVQRLEAYPAGRLGAPGRATGASRAPASPRSCGSPTSRRSSRQPPDGGRDGTLLDAFVQVGVAKEDQPHYLKVVARPEADVVRPHRLRLWVIAARTEAAAVIARTSGVIAPVRTYESPIDRRLEEAGFDSIATVTLLMKETLVRVAEPALVPAGVRYRVMEDTVGPAKIASRESIDDLDALLASLPPEIVDAVHALPDRRR